MTLTSPISSIQIGNTFRFLRLAKNYNQTYLASAIGCKKSLYCKIESGQVRVLSIDKFEQIGYALDVKSSILIDLVKQPLFHSKISTFDEFFRSLQNSSREEVKRMALLTQEALPKKYLQYKSEFDKLLNKD